MFDLREAFRKIKKTRANQSDKKQRQKHSRGTPERNEK